jgi:hypothetical protein
MDSNVERSSERNRAVYYLLYNAGRFVSLDRSALESGEETKQPVVILFLSCSWIHPQ